MVQLTFCTCNTPFIYVFSRIHNLVAVLVVVLTTLSVLALLSAKYLAVTVSGSQYLTGFWRFLATSSLSVLVKFLYTSWVRWNLRLPYLAFTKPELHCRRLSIMLNNQHVNSPYIDWKLYYPKLTAIAFITSLPQDLFMPSFFSRRYHAQDSTQH